MAKKNYYAVRVGLTPGIYKTWAECEANVKGVPKCEYKGFVTLEEAQEYMAGAGAQTDTADKNNSSAQTDTADKNNSSAQAGSNTKISPSAKSKNNSEYINSITSSIYFGQDEVGKGEPFRRVIVVAAYLDGQHMEELNKLSATRDSKNYGLDTDKCVKIGSQLTDFTEFAQCKNGVYENEELGITYSIYSIDNSYYNKIHKQAGSKMSANKILAIMHNRAGINLGSYLSKKGIKVENIVIDNFMGQADYLYKQYTANEKYHLDQCGAAMHYEVKSESKFPAVAVASNIANYVEQLYVNDVRARAKEVGADFEAHGFSNGVEDVQYAFDEITRVYQDLDSTDNIIEFKHTLYYENYIKTGNVH